MCFFSCCYLHMLSAFDLKYIGISVCVYLCVCGWGVLTGAGHGGRVAVGAEERGVAVTDCRPVPERVTVWGTLGASRIRRLGLVKTNRTGCRGTDKGSALMTTLTPVTTGHIVANVLIKRFQFSLCCVLF